MVGASICAIVMGMTRLKWLLIIAYGVSRSFDVSLFLLLDSKRPPSATQHNCNNVLAYCVFPIISPLNRSHIFHHMQIYIFIQHQPSMRKNYCEKISLTKKNAKCEKMEKRKTKNNVWSELNTWWLCFHICLADVVLSTGNFRKKWKIKSNFHFFFIFKREMIRNIVRLLCWDLGATASALSSTVCSIMLIFFFLLSLFASERNLFRTFSSILFNFLDHLQCFIFCTYYYWW